MGMEKDILGLIDDVIAVCTDLMEGKSDEVPLDFKGVKGLIAVNDPTHRKGNVVYAKERIFDGN